MYKTLVTGGLGFIGNELIRQLITEGRGPVLVLDSRARVAPRSEDMGRARVAEADITDRDATRRVFEAFRPDRVIHLAAMHYIPECNMHPDRTLRVNVEGTVNVLEASAWLGVGHVLLASSGAVYADSPTPLGEDSPVAPVDIYGLSKVFAEDLGRVYAARRAVPVTICRLFNAYGPRETNPHIIPEVLSQIRTSDCLMLGNIDTRRDFIHVEDIAQAFVRLAATAPAGLRVVNVGSGKHHSMREIIGVIAELLGRDVRVQVDPARLRPVDKQVQVACTDTLHATVGWRPSLPLRDGLAHLLRFEALL